VGKIAKKKKTPHCQKYTPTDWFLGDFAYWIIGYQTNALYKITCCSASCMHLSHWPCSTYISNAAIRSTPINWKK